MHRYSIMALDTEHIEEICQDIKEQYKTGVADMALFMFKLVPEGTPVIPKAEQQVEKYVKFRDRLREMGLGCGILVQSTIGHGAALSARAPFQHYVGLIGVENSVYDNSWTTCPYDKGFQDYMRHSFEVIAKAEPEVIMVDDDFRLIQRYALGCTCPHHMKAIEKLNGEPIERRRILEAVRGKSEEDKRITDIYVKTQIDALLEGARAMREGIDRVNKKLQGLYCTCGISAEGAADIAKILAGEGNPSIVRVNNGNYSPKGARDLTWAFQRAAIEVTVMEAQGGADYYLAETDTCPQSRYSTGAQSLHSHYTGTILEGITGAKHWITQLNEHVPKGGKAYRRILSKNTRFYDKLSETVPTLKWLGCRAPLSAVPDYCFHGLDNSSVANEWVKCVLERLGLPVYFSVKDGGAAFLEGDSIENFSDEELIKLLSDTLVLDGYAARSIQERGFGKYLGVTVEKWTGSNPSGEMILKINKKVRKQKDLLELVPHDGAEVQSIVYNMPDGKNINALFAGSVIYENELGGKVLTFAGRAKANFVYYEGFSFLNLPRKEFFVNFLRETGNLPVYYPEDAEVYLKAAETPDDELFVAFFNIGLDPIENITLNTDRNIKKIEMLDSDGERKNVTFERKGETLTLDLPAFTLNPVILFLK